MLKKTEMLLDQRLCRRKHEHLSWVRVKAGRRDKERDGGLPKTRWEDDHRVRVKRSERYIELVASLFDTPLPDQRVGDVVHTLSSGNVIAPLMSIEKISGSRSIGTRICSVLSLSLMVTVLSSSVS